MTVELRDNGRAIFLETYCPFCNSIQQFILLREKSKPGRFICEGCLVKMPVGKTELNEDHVEMVWVTFDDSPREHQLRAVCTDLGITDKAEFELMKILRDKGIKARVWRESVRVNHLTSWSMFHPNEKDPISKKEGS